MNNYVWFARSNYSTGKSSRRFSRPVTSVVKHVTWVV